MLGLKDNAGRVVMEGKGIRLSPMSTQAQFKRALEIVPQLKGKHIIELTEKQVNDRKPKTKKNDNK